MTSVLGKRKERPLEEKEVKDKVSEDIGKSPARYATLSSSIGNNVAKTGTKKYGGDYEAALSALQLAIFKGNRYTEMGHKKEAYVGHQLQKWLDKLTPACYKVAECQIFKRFEKYVFLGSTPDFSVIRILTQMLVSLGEAKFLASRANGKVPRDKDHFDYYFTQCHFEAESMGVKKVFLALATDVDFEVVEIEHDASWLKENLPSFVAFYMRYLRFAYEEDDGHNDPPIDLSCLKHVLETENRRRSGMNPEQVVAELKRQKKVDEELKERSKHDPLVDFEIKAIQEKRTKDGLLIDIAAELKRRVDMPRQEAMKKLRETDPEFMKLCRAVDYKERVEPRWTIEEQTMCTIGAEDVEPLLKGRSQFSTREKTLKKILSLAPPLTDDEWDQKMVNSQKRRELAKEFEAKTKIKVHEEYKVRRSKRFPCFAEAQSLHLEGGGLLSALKTTHLITFAPPSYYLEPAQFRRTALGIQPVYIYLKQELYGESEVFEIEPLVNFTRTLLPALLKIVEKYLLWYYLPEGHKKSEKNVRLLLQDDEETADRVLRKKCMCLNQQQIQTMRDLFKSKI